MVVRKEIKKGESDKRKNIEAERTINRNSASRQTIHKHVSTLAGTVSVQRYECGTGDGIFDSTQYYS